MSDDTTFYFIRQKGNKVANNIFKSPESRAWGLDKLLDTFLAQSKPLNVPHVYSTNEETEFFDNKTVSLKFISHKFTVLIQENIQNDLAHNELIFSQNISFSPLPPP